MNRDDIDILVKFWLSVENDFQRKTHHLINHAKEWLQEYGPVTDEFEHTDVLDRMFSVAANYIPSNQEIMPQKDIESE